MAYSFSISLIYCFEEGIYNAICVKLLDEKKVVSIHLLYTLIRISYANINANEKLSTFQTSFQIDGLNNCNGFINGLNSRTVRYKIAHLFI